MSMREEFIKVWLRFEGIANDHEVGDPADIKSISDRINYISTS